jgi:hypothetical protein
VARRPDSGKARRKDLESTGFPALFRSAYARWRDALPPNDQRRAQSVMRDRLGLADTKNIRNWMRGVSAPGSIDAWAALRAVLAEAPANADHLAALDAAFAKARGSASPIIADTEIRGVETDPAACVWKAGRHLPAIRNIVEFRIRLGLNDPTSTGPCPVYGVLILGQSVREAAGRRVLIAFRALELFFESPAHEVRAETIFGSDGKLPAGVSRISGGWRLGPTSDEDGLLVYDPIGGACLFMLDGRGAAVSPTTLELVAKAGAIDIQDADKPARPINGKRRAILDAIFRGAHDPEGKGEYVVGRGEVWQEDQA